jgi:CelD/BcsL family acetyltransferase involved in cellulose biosynthesis
MVEAELVTAPARLAEVEDAWWELWCASSSATVFQSPAWLIPWWDCFAPGDLAMIAAWDDGKLIGLAPLYLESGRLGRRLLPLGIGNSDHLDVLLASGSLAAGTIAEALAALPFGWDSVELEEMLPGADGFTVPPPMGAADTTGGQSACPSLPLGAEVDASGLPMTVPGKRRQFFRRTARQVDGGVAKEIAAEPFLGMLECLHGARWRSREQAGVLADPRVARFHRLALPRLLDEGLARLTVAYIGGAAAAALYQLRWRDRFATYIGGFDPAFAHQSPQNFLVGEALVHAASAGATRFSFLRGREPYKYHWGASDVWNRRRSFRRTSSL